MVPGENTQIVAIQGMCATTTAAADEPRALCIIRDLTNGTQSKQKSAINLPASTTAVQLMLEVGKKFCYDPATFELILARMNATTNVHEHNNETLEELGFCCGKNERNNLVICDKNNVPPTKMEDTATQAENKPFCWDSDTNAIMSDLRKRLPPGTSINYIPVAPPPYTSGSSEASSNYSNTTSSQDSGAGFTYKSTYSNAASTDKSTSSDFTYSSSYSNAVSRQDTGFVGLVNQAMTCYLNSLLQTLFMTPEFRNTLYRWEFDGTEEEGSKSIPFQLQKLFLQLQTSNKPAVGTTELTTSFGWDSSEAWQQHDVQELCRVMFDALEQKFKNTQQADLITRLYEGKLKDYVKCLECDYESAREDTFLDVPLVVRPFGSSQAYSSVGEALQAFVTPEILQGSNQYFCEHCNKKCDAHKGLKFIKFPYLLTLQLKRFDFDPVTMHRIKLNDKVQFPEILNLNDFIKSENNQETCDDGDTTDSGSALDDEGIGYASGCKTGCSLSPEAFSDNDLPDDDEGIDVGPHGPPLENNHELCVNERNLKKSMEKGPYVYELFSIMVHSGSANGGHYYAYIKSFKHGEWYCFNDAQVTRITYDDITKTYGGGPTRGYYSSAYSSSTNAYMLMYRQIDKQKNTECMSPDEFPEHIKALLQCMQEQELRERIMRELDRSMCKIKLFCQHPVQRRMVEMRLKVHEDLSLADATKTAHTIMGLEGVVPLDCCRLVKYDDFHDSLECSFDPNTEETIGELLGGVKSSYKFDLLLEIKKPNEQFQEYKPGGTTVKVHVVDLEQEHVSGYSVTVRSHPTNTVEELRKQIADALGVDGSKMRMILETYDNVAVLLNNSTKTLAVEGFHKSNKVFVEYKDDIDAVKPFFQSKLYYVLDVYGHTICIHVALPKVDKAILDRLRLNDCDANEGQEDSSSDEEAEGKADSSDSGSEKAGGDSTNFEVSVPYNKFDKFIIPDGSTSKYDKLIVECHKSCLIDSQKKSWFKKRYQDDYDEGLGDSEVGDAPSSTEDQAYGNQAIHSDQSEDSSLTDSERTLVGDELSPRNNSPDMSSEIERDLEPLHAGVEVSKPECDTMFANSEAACPVHGQDDSRNMSSPEENTKDSKCGTSDSYKNVCTCAKGRTAPEAPVKNHFVAYTYFDSETGEKMLRVYVDKRITLAQLKKELEPHVGVGADCFKIFRVYSSHQEIECTRLSDKLTSFGDDSKLTVKLGRALRKGEYKVNIYQLRVNDPEPSKYLMDYVIVKGMTVKALKEEILPELREKYGLNIPLNRCRLRKKSWRNPGHIYFDLRKFEKDIRINANLEMFLEELPGPEPMTSCGQTVLFTRMWHPSTFTLDPFREIVIDTSNAECLRKKLSEISQVPEEYVEFAKGKGIFPCDVSLLSIQKELEWQTQSPSTISWHVSVGTDGDVIYYRDKREEIKKLTEDEKRIIINKENARSNKNLKSNYSPRKEKALKIYTLDSKPSSSDKSTSQITTQNSTKTQHIVPDLD